MRRDSNDILWKEVKQKVRARDGNICRLLKVLSLQEGILLRKNAEHLLYQLDPAHFISVSQDSSIMYDENNIVMLNHYSHSNLDSCRNPITGEYISQEEVRNWWERILKGNKYQYEYLKNKDLL